MEVTAILKFPQANFMIVSYPKVTLAVHSPPSTPYSVTVFVRFVKCGVFVKHKVYTNAANV